MKTKANPRVVSEVRRMERRLASIEATERFLIRSRHATIEKAEQLRRLARAYQRAWATRKEGLARAALFLFLNTLTTPFHKAVKMTKRERAAHDSIMRGRR